LPNRHSPRCGAVPKHIAEEDAVLKDPRRSDLRCSQEVTPVTPPTTWSGWPVTGPRRLGAPQLLRRVRHRCRRRRRVRGVAVTARSMRQATRERSCSACSTQPGGSPMVATEPSDDHPTGQVRHPSDPCEVVERVKGGGYSFITLSMTCWSACRRLRSAAFSASIRSTSRVCSARSEGYASLNSTTARRMARTASSR